MYCGVNAKIASIECSKYVKQQYQHTEITSNENERYHIQKVIDTRI